MRCELLNKLFDITKQQEEVISQDEIEIYIELLEERQKIIDQIDAINIEKPAELNDDEREILLKIKEIDDRNYEKFQIEFEKLKEQLKQVRVNKNKTNYYVNSYNVVQEEGLFIDKRNGIKRKP